MKRYVLGLVTGSIAVAALAFLLRTTSAQVPAQGWGIRGAGEAGLVEETITFRTLNGDLRKQAVPRVAVKVPQAYGQLTNVTGTEHQTLWFVDTKGIVRNVDVGRNLVAIQFEN